MIPSQTFTVPSEKRYAPFLHFGALALDLGWFLAFCSSSCVLYCAGEFNRSVECSFCSFLLSRFVLLIDAWF